MTDGGSDVTSTRMEVLTGGLPIGCSITMILTLDKLSRLVVPKVLRERFALGPGDDLEVVIEADGFRLQPVRSARLLVEEKGSLVCSSEVPSAAWDLGHFLEMEREARNWQLGGI